jgi:hypothetical protein
MKKDKLDRLLRAAAKVDEAAESVMPFGFDTRVIALWSGNRRTARPNGVLSLVRRVAFLSAAVIVISSIAAIREASQNREITESFTNEFAIADSAIQDAFSQ